MASADASGIAKLIGIYDFQHPGGNFEVHLRPDGKFFAPKFQARASWNCTESGVLSIEWGKFGQYMLELKDPATRYFEGSAVGKPESWRKMKLKRPGGKFNIEFRADGFNHFVCNDFPAHSHWRLDNAECATPTVYINWGKYGEYELVLAADGETMAGSAKGKPENWR